MRYAWKTVLKATEINIQARDRERSDGARGIVDTDTPRLTAKILVNELVSVLYPCHSEVQLYRPTSVVEMAAITIDMIRIYIPAVTHDVVGTDEVQKWVNQIMRSHFT